jgi:hypothetical protein
MRAACWSCVAVLLVACLLALSLTPGSVAPVAQAGDDSSSEEPMLVHDVYFTLSDPSPEARDALVAACDEHLTEHPGTLFYACGTVSDLDREVNDRDWDVGLHIVFEDRAAHDRYQTSDRHVRFVDENRGVWSTVRVFDTDCAR